MTRVDTIEAQRGGSMDPLRTYRLGIIAKPAKTASDRLPKLRYIDLVTPVTPFMVFSRKYHHYHSALLIYTTRTVNDVQLGQVSHSP